MLTLVARDEWMQALQETGSPSDDPSPAAAPQRAAPRLLAPRATWQRAAPGRQPVVRMGGKREHVQFRWTPDIVGIILITKMREDISEHFPRHHKGLTSCTCSAAVCPSGSPVGGAAAACATCPACGWSPAMEAWSSPPVSSGRFLPPASSVSMAMGACSVVLVIRGELPQGCACRVAAAAASGGTSGGPPCPAGSTARGGAAGCAAGGTLAAGGAPRPLTSCSVGRESKRMSGEIAVWNVQAAQTATRRNISSRCITPPLWTQPCLPHLGCRYRMHAGYSEGGGQSLYPSLTCCSAACCTSTVGTSGPLAAGGAWVAAYEHVRVVKCGKGEVLLFSFVELWPDTGFRVQVHPSILPAPAPLPPRSSTCT